MIRLSIILLAFLSVLETQAHLKLPALIGNNMVLQRNATPKIWGEASPGETITITPSWNGKNYRTVCDEQGQWCIQIETIEEGGPHSIQIATPKEKMILENILIGDVWICSGQSNMEHQLSGMMNQPVANSNDIVLEGLKTSVRMFTVARDFDIVPHSDCQGTWQENTCANAYNFSAVGYVFATTVARATNIPIGIICSAYGGSPIEPFLSEEAALKFPNNIKLKKDIDISKAKSPNFIPTSIYNAMILPLVNYSIKGFLFYQGESNNISNNSIYSQTLAEMVHCWRQAWGEETLPFYYVQIAPWHYNDSQGMNGALLREQQSLALKIIPNSEMVTTGDVGEEFIIHPAKKEVIGKRLAYTALARDYGFKGLGFRPPIYKSMKIKDDGSVELFFDNAALHGIYANRFLILSKEDSGCFEIAGEDRIFHPAKATLTPGKELTVRSDAVPHPVAVRYCFRNYFEPVLFNGYGIPASPFRTDNWDLSTGNSDKK